MTIVILQHRDTYFKCMCDSLGTWLRHSETPVGRANWVDSVNEALLSNCNTVYTGGKSLAEWCSDIDATIHSEYSITDYPEYFI